eukprot:CAMPEP_0118858792 /NCGR_PEP_ID=MMETSP1163-20130328/5293_1 /TAXON_ID=124430 /ORGANISM="Phaeomonas parva, Strain CCMP2877" /LENGTH=425 /DNA_ID=CAMNT_0006792287 /DNA_START=267 /DNA_END=1544 /DNA_ORIENTATION=+
MSVLVEEARQAEAEGVDAGALVRPGRDWSSYYLAQRLSVTTLESLNDHVLQHVLYFCTEADLMRWEQASRFCRASTERAWQRLVRARWAVNTTRFRSRAYGGSTWRRAYRAMAGRHRLPRGRHTQKHNLVFAHGRGGGVEGWVTLHHREDCRLPRRIAGVGFGAAPPEGDAAEEGPADGVRLLELRLVLQNLNHASVDVFVGAASLQLLTEGGLTASLRQVGAHVEDLKALHPVVRRVHPDLRGAAGAGGNAGGAGAGNGANTEGVVTGIGANTGANAANANVAFPRMLAYNGLCRKDLRSAAQRRRHGECRGRDDVALVPDLDAMDATGAGTPVSARRVRLVNPMHFAVVALVFQLPTGFVYETDALTRARRLRIPAVVTSGVDGCRRALTVTVDFKNEEFLYRHYKHLPGGFLVLQTAESGDL